MNARPSIKRVIQLIGVLALSAVPSAAQSFNVDVGSPTSPAGVPSAIYGAAASQPGTWNAFSAVPAGPVTLLDLVGVTTGATLSVTGGQGNFHFNNAATTGDDQALLDDTGDLGPLGGGADTATYTFAGLVNGSYRVFVYAWTPDVTAAQTVVTISGGIPCPQFCGGLPWSGTYDERNIYVQERVDVTTGTLTITVKSGATRGSCNGIQLVNSPGEGAVLATHAVNPSTFAPEAVIEPDPIDSVEDFKYVWVLGVGNGAKLHRCRRVFGALEYLQSFDLSGHFSDPQTLSSYPDGGRNRFSVWGGDLASPPVNATATFNWNAAGNTVTHRYTTYAFQKVNTSSFVETTLGSVTYRTFGILNNGDIAMYLRDGITSALSFQFSWTPPPGLNIVDLALDPYSDVLWAFSRTNPCGGPTNLVEFIPLNPNTGAIVGPRFLGDVTLPAPNLAKSVEFTASPLDPNRFALMALHETGAVDTLVYYSLTTPATPSPVSYCTSGVSTNGCQPVLSTSANPSLFGLHDATITAAPMEGAKTGLCFYGMSGPVAIPWGVGTSFLCVKAPTQRFGVQSSGGTPGLCNGVFSFDLLDFTYTTPTALGQPFLAGDTLHVQAWYRDPPASKSTNLTDALQLTWQP